MLDDPVRNIVVIELPNMLLLGSLGRNSGKTECGEAIIRRLKRTTGEGKLARGAVDEPTASDPAAPDPAAPAPAAFAPAARDGAVEQRVIAVKVTTIRDEAGGCPRGGKGCGVCGSLSEDFDLIEERSTGPDDVDSARAKDTHRLLRAGADHVYWLRVKEPCLHIGAQRLSELCESGVPVICESNSLRSVVKPGLFLMMKPEKLGRPKESAVKVSALADVEIRYSERGGADGPVFGVFAPTIERIGFENGRFDYRLPVTAVVLAGGKSSRMGSDKALLKVDGKAMIEHVVDRLRPWFDDVLISAGESNRYPFLHVRQLSDPFEDTGPLAGILAGLEASPTEYTFFHACDIPDADLCVAMRMFFRSCEDAERSDGAKPDAIVPINPDGKIEPVFSFYRRTLIPLIHRRIEEHRRSIRGIYDQCIVKYWKLGPDETLKNLNTPSDYAQYVE